MSRVPDAVEPIRGWRAWVVGTLGEQGNGPLPALVLRAVAWPQDPWPARRPAVASCHLGHAAPDPGCQCGLHAFREATEVRTVFLPDMLFAPATVVGPVGGWGTLAMHERGWRAQYAYPEALALVCGWCLTIREEVKTATVAIAPCSPTGVVGLCAGCVRPLTPAPGRFSAADVLAVLCSRYEVPPISIGALERITVAGPS
jgi:hypothetical protein